jgi:hypothetical protein
MWRLPPTSGYSYPRVAAIQIDVHPAEENPTNTPRTLPTPVHARPAYTFCGQSPYVTTFQWLPRSWNRPLHPEEVLETKDRLARPLSWVTSFLLPCDSPGVGERGFSSMVTQLHQLTGPISPACDRCVQYLLTGANWMVLNWHSRGLQPWSASLPHIHSLTFPTSCLHFPLKAPPGLHFNQVLAINQGLSIKEPTAATWSFDHSAIYRSLYLRLAITNDLSLAEGSQG